MIAGRCLFDWSIAVGFLLGVVLLSAETEATSLETVSEEGSAMASHRRPLVEGFADGDSVHEHRRKLKGVRRKKDKRGRGDEGVAGTVESAQMLRNEKDSLVRNRTIEILKTGVRILSAGDSTRHHPRDNPAANYVNGTILEKILSSAASKPGMLISASGMYKVPVGGNLYRSRGEKMEEEEEEEQEQESNQASYDYEYDVGDRRNKSDRSHESVDGDIKQTLKQIVANLRNEPERNASEGCAGRPRGSDPCQRWLRCRHNLESAFSGSNALPACPCAYPSTIFYDDAVWDEKQSRYFRWRDASGESERLDIYKPGAAYCIRSLMSQGGGSISSQQCCYDRKLRLLTRGSGAGTVNYVSPDVSKVLHDTVDVLPWRLCKGDFTRYNLARKPDNGNSCPENPNDEQYQLQVKLSKHF